jgi:hypothetical protein
MFDFDFFNQQTTKDVYKMSGSTSSQIKEYFRVGVTDTGNTTLTLIGDDGMTMTLSMTPYTCEQLIRMLRATYDETVETQGD